MENNNKEIRILYWAKYLLAYVISVPLLVAGTYASLYFFAHKHTMNVHVTPEQVNATYIGVVIFALVAACFLASKLAVKWSVTTNILLTLLIIRAISCVTYFFIGNKAGILAVVYFFDTYLIFPSIFFVAPLMPILRGSGAQEAHVVLVAIINMGMLFFYVIASCIISFIYRVCEGRGKCENT